MCIWWIAKELHLLKKMGGRGSDVLSSAQRTFRKSGSVLLARLKNRADFSGSNLVIECCMC